MRPVCSSGPAVIEYASALHARDAALCPRHRLHHSFVLLSRSTILDSGDAGIIRILPCETASRHPTVSCLEGRRMGVRNGNDFRLRDKHPLEDLPRSC